MGNSNMYKTYILMHPHHFSMCILNQFMIDVLVIALAITNAIINSKWEWIKLARYFWNVAWSMSKPQQRRYLNDLLFVALSILVHLGRKQFNSRVSNTLAIFWHIYIGRGISRWIYSFFIIFLTSKSMIYKGRVASSFQVPNSM